MNILEDCTLCPRNCHVNRLAGKTGYCKQTSELKVARASLHFWEEPCLSGTSGSGTVFFSGCSLGCAYCQNYSISTGMQGKKITSERLADIFLELQHQQACNVNLVTPTHFVPQIIKAIELSRAKGLHIPVAYNTSGYETIETVKQLEGYVDVYLPDMKYKSQELSRKYSGCPDYFLQASGAIAEMVKLAGKPQFNELGIMTKGVIVRHLVLPGCIKDSKEILSHLFHTFGDMIFVSIMNQYTPLPNAARFPELNRRITDDEYDEVVEYAISLGIENGFIQEGETASESFIPEFDGFGV